MLRRRCEQALRRERRGFTGGRYVVRVGRERLRAVHRSELDEKVDHVTARDDGCGYDVQSFTAEGEERHLEVRATSRSLDAEMGFQLTEKERQQVTEATPHWSFYRVWNFGTKPEGRDIGNVDQRMAVNGWRLEKASWHCHPESE